MITLFLTLKRILPINNSSNIINNDLFCSGNITYFNSLNIGNYILCDILYPPNNNFCSTFEDSFYQRGLYIPVPVVIFDPNKMVPKVLY